MNDTTIQSINSKLLHATNVLNEILIEIHELKAPIYRDLDKITQKIIDALVEADEITDEDEVHVGAIKVNKKRNGGK